MAVTTGDSTGEDSNDGEHRNENSVHWGDVSNMEDFTAHPEAALDHALGWEDQDEEWEEVTPSEGVLVETDEHSNRGLKAFRHKWLSRAAGSVASFTNSDVARANEECL